MKDTLLVSPKFDKATKISFEIYSEAKKKLKAKINLEGKNVTRENFEKSLKNISIIGFWDHGRADALIDNSENALVDAANVHLLKGKEVFTMACLSSKELGRLAVKEGVSLWQGYNAPIVVTSQPLFFYNFEESFNKGILERSYGSPIWLCYLRQKWTFKKNIRKCVKNEGLFFASILRYNLFHLEYLRPKFNIKFMGMKKRGAIKLKR